MGNQSGAVVTQIAKKLLLEIGNQVSVFSFDVEDGKEEDGTELFSRTRYNALSNWQESKYIIEYKKVLEKSDANVIFTLGCVTNINLAYLEIARNRKIKVISKIFMQDFFCVKFYANNTKGPCTKCLDNSYLEAFKNKCIIKKPIDYVKTANRILIIKRLEKILPKIDYVIGSTDEQISFYKKFGVLKEKCIKIPLFFDHNRLRKIKPVMGNYFVCIAQNRIEKGFHYLKDILSHLDSSLRIVVAYNNAEQAKIAIERYGFQKFIDNGLMEVKYDLQWGSGLADLVAKSRGVIIPSIWPTTTEFALLESLGYKKPVFCFDVGIHHEKIVNNVNGFITEVGNTKNMANQLKQINEDTISFKQISKGAELLYQELTDWDNWKNKLKFMGL